MAKKRKMIAQINYNYKKSDAGRNYEIELEVDLSRFEKQYGKAQYQLDSAVMKAMEKYMPMNTGVFINVTKAMSAAIAGSGTVIAAAPPFGRFLYEGKVMVDEVTKSPWARKGARKEVTQKDIEYSTNKHPEATSHWFDIAKERHIDTWVEKAKRTAGGK